MPETGFTVILTKAGTGSLLGLLDSDSPLRYRRNDDVGASLALPLAPRPQLAERHERLWLWWADAGRGHPYGRQCQ
jgi:hypothetical protein